MSKFEALLKNLGCSWCWLELKHQQEKSVVKEEPTAIFIMGPSGSGKSIVGQKLALTIGFTYAKMSDLVEKEAVKTETIIQLMKNGFDVPPEITTKILNEYIESVKHTKGFVISGFPNNVDEAKRFEMDYFTPRVLIYCSIPMNVYVERNLKIRKGVDAKFLKEKYAEQHNTFQRLYRLYENKTLKMSTDDGTVESNNDDLIKDLELYWGFNFHHSKKHK